jgi:hypothetical protein
MMARSPIANSVRESSSDVVTSPGRCAALRRIQLITPPRTYT